MLHQLWNKGSGVHELHQILRHIVNNLLVSHQHCCCRMTTVYIKNDYTICNCHVKVNYKMLKDVGMEVLKA